MNSAQLERRRSGSFFFRALAVARLLVSSQSAPFRRGSPSARRAVLPVSLSGYAESAALDAACARAVVANTLAQHLPEARGARPADSTTAPCGCRIATIGKVTRQSQRKRSRTRGASPSCRRNQRSRRRLNSSAMTRTIRFSRRDLECYVPLRGVVCGNGRNPSARDSCRSNAQNAFGGPAGRPQ